MVAESAYEGNQLVMDVSPRAQRTDEANKANPEEAVGISVLHEAPPAGVFGRAHGLG